MARIKKHVYWFLAGLLVAVPVFVFTYTSISTYKQVNREQLPFYTQAVTVKDPEALPGETKEVIYTNVARADCPRTIQGVWISPEVGVVRRERLIRGGQTPPTQKPVLVPVPLTISEECAGKVCDYRATIISTCTTQVNGVEVIKEFPPVLTPPARFFVGTRKEPR